MIVTEELKRLRLSAAPPISVRGMAEALGVTSSAYHFYESAKGFKQAYLPMDFARRIAAVLADRGVNPDDVLALAGVGAGEAAGPKLTAGEERLLGLFRRLGSGRRKLLLDVASAFQSG